MDIIDLSFVICLLLSLFVIPVVSGVQSYLFLNTLKKTDGFDQISVFGKALLFTLISALLWHSYGGYLFIGHYLNTWFIQDVPLFSLSILVAFSVASLLIFIFTYYGFVIPLLPLGFACLMGIELIIKNVLPNNFLNTLFYIYGFLILTLFIIIAIAYYLRSVIHNKILYAPSPRQGFLRLMTILYFLSLFVFVLFLLTSSALLAYIPFLYIVFLAALTLISAAALYPKTYKYFEYRAFEVVNEKDGFFKLYVHPIRILTYSYIILFSCAELFLFLSPLVLLWDLQFSEMITVQTGPSLLFILITLFLIFLGVWLMRNKAMKTLKLYDENINQIDGLSSQFATHISFFSLSILTQMPPTPVVYLLGQTISQAMMQKKMSTLFANTQVNKNMIGLLIIPLLGCFLVSLTLAILQFFKLI